MLLKRIYYVPGMISIVGLVGLLFFITPRPGHAGNSIRLILPADSACSYFSTYLFYKSIENKRIIMIDLSEEQMPGDVTLFNKKLHFISTQIEALQFTHDTTAVLQIKLGTVNTYGHFVWILNQALIYKLKRYVFADDSFYLLANPAKTSSFNVIITLSISSHLRPPYFPLIGIAYLPR